MGINYNSMHFTPYTVFHCGLYMCCVEIRHVTHSRKKNIHIKYGTHYSQYKATDMGFILWLVLFLLQYDHREPSLKVPSSSATALCPKASFEQPALNELLKILEPSSSQALQEQD